MMFMHMPRKLGIPVLLIVAVCLGAYYVWTQRPVRVGEWEIYQGTGVALPREDETDPGRGGTPVDICYTVRQSMKPLFRCTCLMSPPNPTWNGGYDMYLTYRSEWPTTLRLVVWGNDGAAYEALVSLEHTEDWKDVRLEESSFLRRGGPVTTGGQEHVDFRRIRPQIDFYDGSGVTRPSTRFSNRLQLAGISFIASYRP